MANKKTENKKTENKEVATKEVEVKAVETKDVKPAKETVVKEAKKPETKKTEKQAKSTANADKTEKVLSIEEVAKMYDAAGIKCKNPDCKGKYRIMGSKSSLNVTKTEYIIYTTPDDFSLVSNEKIDGVEYTEGGNATDRVRPNTVRCKTVAALKALLKKYSLNPMNAITAAVVEQEVAK